MNPMAPLWWLYSPVAITARLGAQMAALTWARSKRIPCWAKRSRFGVRPSGMPPKAPRDSACKSSAVNSKDVQSARWLLGKGRPHKPCELHDQQAKCGEVERSVRVHHGNSSSSFVLVVGYIGSCRTRMISSNDLPTQLLTLSFEFKACKLYLEAEVFLRADLFTREVWTCKGLPTAMCFLLCTSTHAVSR